MIPTKEHEVLHSLGQHIWIYFLWTHEGTPFLQPEEMNWTISISELKPTRSRHPFRMCPICGVAESLYPTEWSPLIDRVEKSFDKDWYDSKMAMCAKFYEDKYGHP